MAFSANEVSKPAVSLKATPKGNHFGSAVYSVYEKILYEWKTDLHNTSGSGKDLSRRVRTVSSQGYDLSLQYTGGEAHSLY